MKFIQNAGAVVATGLALAAPAVGGVLYVNGSLTTGAGTGASWADAFGGPTALTAALQAAGPGDQVWVAQGVYLPSATGNRTASFQMKAGVEIYGGFVAGQSSLSQRDWIAHPTVLSGDLLSNDGSGVRTDNSFHVVEAVNVPQSGVLDGFVVTGGNANLGSGDKDRGAGLRMSGSSAVIRHCTFQNCTANYCGGAMFITQGEPVVDECRIVNNTAGQAGGGIYGEGTSLRLTRSYLTTNTASRGGGVGVQSGLLFQIVNCVVWANNATGTGGGGGVWCINTNVQMGSCTVVANKTNSPGSASAPGGGMRSEFGGQITVSNSIFWGNTGPSSNSSEWQLAIESASSTSVSYTCVQNGTTGSGITTTDPFFVNAAAGDLRLLPTSLAIDSGSYTLLVPGTAVDLDGNPRVTDSIVKADTGVGLLTFLDRGAYEWMPPPCPGDMNGNLFVDGTDLGILLDQFGGGGTADLNNDGVVDGVDLGLLLGHWGGCL